MSGFLTRLERKRRRYMLRNARCVCFWGAALLALVTLPVAVASLPLIVAVFAPIIILTALSVFFIPIAIGALF